MSMIHELHVETVRVIQGSLLQSCVDLSIGWVTPQVSFGSAGVDIYNFSMIIQHIKIVLAFS